MHGLHPLKDTTTTCGGDVRVGKIPPSFGALCTVAGQRTYKKSFGIHTGCTQSFFGIRRRCKKLFLGFARAQRLILSCNTRAPVPPCRRKMLAAGPGSKKWPGLRRKNSGGTLRHQSERRFPCRNTPPPPPRAKRHKLDLVQGFPFPACYCGPGRQTPAATNAKTPGPQVQNSRAASD